MSRPTRTQILHRRSALAALVAGLLVLAVFLAGVLGGDSDAAPERSDGSGRGADAARRPTSVAVVPPGGSEPRATTAPTTTTMPTGVFVPALDAGPVVGEGPLHTYRVEVELGTGIDPDAFANEVEEILSDRRGWVTVDGLSLQRVSGDTEADITVTLATPATTDRLCFPLITESYYSCAPDTRAIINLDRWLTGAPSAKLGPSDYRRYVISHEVGHTLGHTHVECPAEGAPAPVMMQQTVSIGLCAPNPWPVLPEARAG